VDLTSSEVEAHTVYAAYGGYNLIAGEKVVIEVAGATELDQTCPAGKKLTLVISVRAELTDE